MPKFEFECEVDSFQWKTIIKHKRKLAASVCYAGLKEFIPCISRYKKFTLIVDTDKKGKLWLARDKGNSTVWAYTTKPVINNAGIYYPTRYGEYRRMKSSFPIRLKSQECLNASIIVKRSGRTEW